MRAAIFFCSSGGQQLGHAQRRLDGARIVRIEQPVDARAMRLGGEHVAVAIEDLLLHRGIELMIAPRRNHQRLGAGIVAVLDIDAGKRRLAGTGQWRRIFEECSDLVGTGIGQEENRLRLLAQLVLRRPVRMGEAELLDIFGIARNRRTVAIFVPKGEIAGGRVLDPRRRGGAGAQHLPDIGLVGIRKVVRQDRLEDRGVIHRRRRRGDCRRERALHGEGERGRAIGIGIGRRHVGDDLRRRGGGRRGRDRGRRRQQSRRLRIVLGQGHDRSCLRHVGLRRDRR